MTYRSKHFCIEEYVSPCVFADRGELAWELLDDRLLITDDALRDRYGRITINDWKWGGRRKWSGLRTSSSPDFSQYSQHTFGRASDKLFMEASVEEVRADIIKNKDLFPYITSIELGTTWLHSDHRNCTILKTFNAPIRRM
jgi:hypothetical protein